MFKMLRVEVCDTCFSDVKLTLSGGSRIFYDTDVDAICRDWNKTCPQNWYKNTIETARPSRDIDRGKILENLPTMFRQFEISPFFLSFLFN